MSFLSKAILPIVIIGAGIGAMSALINSGEAEQRVDVVPPPLQVEVIKVAQSEELVKVYASGVVQPSHQVNLVPQVQGKVVYVADGLRSGSRFRKGEVIARIEQADYKLAVAGERSRVEQAKLNLTIEKERELDAQREWELLGNTGEAPELASRKPQLRLAELGVEAAEAGLQRAELALSRTVLKAPFDCIVKSEQLELGQVVGGSPVATLQGTEQFQVRVSVPTAHLPNLHIPGINGDDGSKADVRFQVSNDVELHKEGHVLGLESELDPQARTINVLIGIDDPMSGDGLPLLIGSYVDVELDGQSVMETVRIPSTALREGSYVLIADAEDKLAKKDVKIGWFDQADVVLTAGLTAGDRIVTTSMSYPIYGAELAILDSLVE